MQEGKNKRLALLLLALTIITATAIVLATRGRRDDIAPGMFRLSDYASVSRIVLKSPSGPVELTWSGSRWKVNDRYNADRELVTVLFATLRQVEPKRPVAKDMLDSVARNLEHNGTEVALFEGEREVQRFFAGGNDRKTQAYFMNDDNGNVYVMAIPGYKIYVSGIFELTVNEWREKYVFGFNWINFRDLTAEYPAHPAEGFTIRKEKNGMFGINGLKTDTAKIHTYLDHVSLLTANQYLEPGRFTDSLRLARPAVVLTVTDVSNTRHSLSLFEGEGSQVPGLLNEAEGVLFSRLKLQPILRKKSYFEQQ